MQVFKKSLSILLSLALILSLFAVLPVTAAETVDAAETGAPADASDGGEGCDDLAVTGAASDLTELGANTYPLAVGGTPVTPGNCGDIFSDGTASYNPGTRTLTLNNPILNTTYNNNPNAGVIYLIDEENEYTITGTYHMDHAVSNYGLFCSGNVKLDGNFTFYGKMFGVGVDKTLTINSGSLKGVATNPANHVDGSIGIYTAGNNNSKVIINDGVTKVQAQGGDISLQTDELVAPHFRATSPVGAYYISTVNDDEVRTFVLEDASDVATSIVLEPFYGTLYDLWVGARRVDSENKDDILGDGKASYDPETKTLTLNAPTITNYHKEFGYKDTHKIFSKDDLTIKGSYQMTPDQVTLAADPTPGDGVDDTVYLKFAFCSEKDLTLDGNFTLYAKTFPVFAENNVTISGGTVTIPLTEGSLSGIMANTGAVTIGDGFTRIDVEVQERYFPLYGKDIVLPEGCKFPLTASPVIAYNDQGFRFIVDYGNDNAVVSHVVIVPAEEPAVSYDIVVGKTLITSKNYTDVLGDGKVSFDPDTNTLTLSDPEISDVLIDNSTGKSYKFYCAVPVTLKGSYHMTSADCTYGFFGSDPVTFDGSFTFMGNENAVYTWDGITVASGSLKAVTNGSIAIYNRGGSFNVTNGASRVEANCNGYAIVSPVIETGDEIMYESPEGAKAVMISGYDFMTVINSDYVIADRAVLRAVVRYDVWLGSARVTERNYTDILGDGKASFDPGTNTLTLNEPTISGSYQNSKIYIGGNTTVTIKGKYFMNDENVSTGLYASSVVLDGDFTFYGRTNAIFAVSLQVRGGALKAIGRGTSGIEVMASFMVGSGASKVTAQGGTYAISCTMSNFVISSPLKVTVPTNGQIKQYTIMCTTVVNSSGNPVTYAEIENPNKTYGLWLGGIAVTAGNRSNILNNGRASYDPDTKTLTLNDPTINGFVRTNGISYKIYATDSLTVKGKYTMSAADCEVGIRSGGSLTLSGAFTFRGVSCAVMSAADCTVSSGSLTVYGGDGGSSAINAGGAFNVNNSVTQIEMKGSTYPVVASSIVIGNEMVISFPSGGRIIRQEGSFYTIGCPDGALTDTATIRKKSAQPQAIGLEGFGSEITPYLIYSADDWNKVSVYVANGSTTSGKYFRLMENITVATMIGSTEDPFCGVFDGNGKTITLAIVRDDAGEAYVAPFGCIAGATIRNLKVAGSIKGGIHVSALVGTFGGNKNLIENVAVTASIECLSSHCAGFVGHGGTYSVTIKGCVFNGSFSGSAGTVGVFYGWSDYDATVKIENCLDLSASEYPLGYGRCTVTIANTYYTNEAKTPGTDHIWTDIGKRGYSVTGDGFDLTLKGTPGVCCEGAVYAAEGEKVSLTMPEDDILYEADKGNAVQNGRSIVLNMPRENIVIAPSQGTYYTDYSDISSEGSTEGAAADLLFDGDASTKWYGAIGDSPSVTFRVADTIIPAGYLLTTADDAADNAGSSPTAWKLEGSADGEEWFLLVGVTDNRTLGAVNGKTYAFSFNHFGINGCSYFRFTVTGSGSGTFRLGGLQIVGSLTPDAPYIPSDPEEAYELWLGDTQVTYANREDILSDGGKAQYDPATHTLTLHDPVITGYHTRDVLLGYEPFGPPIIDWWEGAIYSGIDLNIKGSYHQSGSNLSFCGIFAEQDLTLDGDFVVSGGYNGILVFGDLIVKSGTLSAKSKNLDTKDPLADGGIMCNGNLVIESRVVRLEAESRSNAAILAGAVYIDDGLYINKPTGSTVVKKNDRYYVCGADGESDAQFVLIENEAITYFDLWVINTQVTSKNMDDVMNDGGKVRFDPATSTLYFNDPVFTETRPGYISSTSCLVLSNIDFTLKGSYHMTGAMSDYVIITRNSVTLDGDFTLYGTDSTIFADGVVTIRSGVLKAYGGNSSLAYAIQYGAGFVIENGADRVELSGAYRVVNREYMTLGDEVEVVYTDSGELYHATHLILDTHKRTVSYDMNGHGEVIDPQRVPIDTAGAKPDDPVEEGWTFGGWYADEDLTTPYDFTQQVSDSRTVYLKWTVNTYQVTFDPNGGSGEMEGTSADYGTAFTLPACAFTAPERAVFDRWEQGAPGETITITGDTQIKPVWKTIPRLLGDVDDNGKVNIFDASDIQKSLAGVTGKINYSKLDPSDPLFRVADADGNGKVNIFDASLIQKYIAGDATAQHYGIGAGI